ncbi:MAG: TlpA family protein disulfide reductase [Candidatus Eisenbacteria bacterium]|nr:TlpA family protein disulfide reductase [Candidatus Eisenbacteria bacterium]
MLNRLPGAPALALIAVIAAGAAMPPSGAPSALAAEGAAAPDVQSILADVTRAYTTLGSGYFEGRGQVRLVVHGQSQQVEFPMRCAFGESGRFLREIQHEAMGQTAVSDGNQLWLYVGRFNQYIRHPLTAADTDPAFPAPPNQPNRDPFADYRALDAHLRGPRLERLDTLQVGPDKVPCHVVAFDSLAGGGVAGASDAGGEMWIDVARHLVLRQQVGMAARPGGNAQFDSISWTTSYEMVRVGEPLPESLFVFSAPNGAQEVEQFGPQRPKFADLTGKPRIDFTLNDLSGKPRSLKDYHGKVVLLDFWATWCGPCRMELPIIMSLYAEMKKKGLEVLAVNVAEEREKPAEFVKKFGYTFPVLLDTDGKVSQQYQANAIPTVAVVDRTGKIVAHFAGARSEEDLRAALAKAGLK